MLITKDAGIDLANKSQVMSNLSVRSLRNKLQSKPQRETPVLYQSTEFKGVKPAKAVPEEKQEKLSNMFQNQQKQMPPKTDREIIAAA